MEFQLFRIKVFLTGEQSLFVPTGIVEDRSLALRWVLESLPSTELYRGVIWHIGNLTQIDVGSIYFRIGKTTKSNLPIYTGSSFVDEERENSPYTHILLDLRSEVAAIAGNPNVGNPTLVASRLLSLLSSASRSREMKATYSIEPLSDPESFIEYLETAVSVLSFSVKITRPNAFDAHEDYIKPMERMVENAAAASGEMKVAGDSLNVATLADVTRSAAATGDDVSARLIERETGKKVVKKLKGNPVIVKDEQDAIGFDRAYLSRLIDMVRALYARVRGRI